MKNILKDNRGLTLVEMLISFAILSMMMVAVFAFMSNMTTQYQNSNNEVTVQNEVQTLMQQLENYIIDANLGVELDISSGGYDLYVMSSDGFCVISYDGDDDVRKLYYYDYTTVWASSTDVTKENCYTLAHSYHTDTSTTATKDLLAEYVAVFKVKDDDLSQTINADSNYVALEITIEKLSRSYTATKNIYLRNQIVTPTVTTTVTTTATPTPTA